MAPEQLEGREADARTDIFACGAVLYQMTTGRRAFEAKSQASLIAAIMESRPPAIDSLRPESPLLLNRLIEKCLAKDPNERWQSAADLATALRWVAGTKLETATVGTPAISRGGRVAWAVAAAATLGLLAALGALWFNGRQKPVEPSELKLQVVTPPTSNPLSIAISPDGQRLVFVASTDAKTQLWLRPLDSLTAQPLEGTEHASFPFWSPDNRSVAFFADGKLKRIDIAGGQPQVLADAALGRGGAWSREGVILFVPGTSTPIYRVPEAGGEVTPATRPRIARRRALSAVPARRAAFRVLRRRCPCRHEHPRRNPRIVGVRTFVRGRQRRDVCPTEPSVVPPSTHAAWHTLRSTDTPDEWGTLSDQ